MAGLPIQVQAQSDSAIANQTLPSRSIASLTFEPPKEGKPENTEGGASRDGGVCPQDSNTVHQPVTLLLPANHYGLTVAEHPTFFVYVPQTSAQKALFVLRDENEDYYYQKTLSIPPKAGIVSFKLPADAPVIEIGKGYKWSFVLICGDTLKPDSPRGEGRIKRIQPNPALSSQLQNLSPLERASLYGKDGIWYDTLTSLAELKRSQSDNLTLTANWEKLLRSVGLEAIATKPLL
ncbi:MAG TPA: hypothetical protein DCE56_11520 [Cyanobacteria bacterium UBA8553]|nr:hypothetical protein [Cyanobacteria bacterium UBA8553]HAJ63347.1 hypothetical protein [Cyanobacteria bacterium UBA8543]